MLLALFCGFFVNLIKKSLTTRFGAMDFMEITKDAQPLQEVDIDLMLRTVGVYEGV